ncbi:hypothetical protein A5715_07305 [Mycolicibacter heraklionensis]|nr:hypothetical protein A5715_07305 [Mycolicibacter heraklionensis]
MDQFLATLRASRPATYALTGALGGLLGAVFGELFESDRLPLSKTTLIVTSAFWMAAIASVLAAVLYMGGEWYQRHELRPRRVAEALGFGAIAGLIAGGVAQAIYGMDFGTYDADSLMFKNYVTRTLCWGLMGALVGALLSRSIPNLGVKRGAVAGLAGGVLGCIGFLIATDAMTDRLGRLVGMTVLGVALGLAIHIAENLFREASIEVLWAPNESTRVGLGPQPVTVGGGEDHIFQRGLPPHVSSITFAGGIIEHVETATGKRTPLQDGSRLRIGGLNMVVHAAK